MNDALRAKLLAMSKQDMRVRAELLAGNELFDGYHPRMAAVHEKNADALQAIIVEYGWPGKSLAGDEGAEAAWMILQHSVSRPKLLRMCLPILRKAAEVGEIPAAHVAYLDDRICVFEGRPQKFGTHFDWDGNGQLAPYPLLDPERTDEYRASAGLGPLSERIAEARRRAHAEGETQPADFANRQRQKADWARKVGWR